MRGGRTLTVKHPFLVRVRLVEFRNTVYIKFKQFTVYDRTLDEVIEALQQILGDDVVIRKHRKAPESVWRESKE